MSAIVEWWGSWDRLENLATEHQIQAQPTDNYSHYNSRCTTTSTTHPGDEEAAQHVCHPRLLHQPVEAVSSKVLDVCTVQQRPLGISCPEQPTHVGVVEPFVGAVQVQGCVAVQVVVPVVGHPLQRGALHGVQRKVGEHILDHRVGLEGAVGQQPAQHTTD